MHVLIAPNAFKNSLSADEAADAIQQGLHSLSVENTITGTRGAAKIFGPQKGAGVTQVNILEQCLEKLNEVTARHTAVNMSLIKHGGAGGGCAAGLFTFLNARLESGIDYFLGVTQFKNALEKCNVVITGEGSLDDQTMNGKGPLGVARFARKYNIPVIGIAGQVPLEPGAGLQEYFDVIMAVGNGPAGLEYAIKTTRENLIRTSVSVAGLLRLGMMNNATR